MLKPSTLIDRIKLASVLQCHVRTISRAVTKAGLGRPIYRSGLALFPAATISQALKIRPQWLDKILNDPEECLTSAQAARLLGMETTLFHQVQQRTGFPTPFADWREHDTRSKRYSLCDVKRAAKYLKAEAA